MQLEESKEKEEKEEKEKRRRRRWRGKKNKENSKGGRQGGREEKQTSYINWMTDPYETMRKIILCIGSKKFSLFINIVSILKF